VSAAGKRSAQISETLLLDRHMWLRIDDLRRFGDFDSQKSAPDIFKMASESDFQFVRSAGASLAVWRRRKPEFDSWIKSLFALLFVVLGTLASSLTIVFVNDRLPDQRRYPPLPDLVLDNLPHIPWAFAVAEYLVCV
jgi:hypothetical protein